MSIPSLDRLVFLGTSFRRIGFDRLGELVIPPGQEQRLRDLAEHLDAVELVYLATCNRVECYAVTREVRAESDLKGRMMMSFAGAGGLRAKELRCAQGLDAVEHLFCMVSSLDSLVVGESEVSGQARRALQRSLDVGLAGAGLRALIERAVVCNRRVRGETQVGALSASVGALAVQKIKKYFGAQGPQRSVVVGVGPMSIKVARALQGSEGERIFVNRTRSRAVDLAQRFGGRALSVTEFLSAPPARIDLLFSATSAPHPIFSREDLAAPAGAGTRRRPLVVCDLGVPSDIDPGLGEHPGVRMVTMADIERLATQNRSRLSRELPRARAVVRREVARVAREGSFRDAAEAGAKALLSEELSHLSPDARDLFLRYSRSLASRMARQPRVLEREVVGCSR